MGNRVSRKQETTDPASWNHVASEHNPADCASRGLSPWQLMSPRWLRLDISEWPIQWQKVPSYNVEDIQAQQ